MKQENHEAHDDLVTLDADKAREVHDFIADQEIDEDAASDLLVTLDNIANGEEGATLTAEQARYAAGIVRDYGNGDNDDLLTALDSVAEQHELGGPKELGSDHDGGVGDVDRDNDAPVPAPAANAEDAAGD